MSEYPHLENAPIREALIDIQVNPRPELDIAEIRKFRESVKEDYPKEQEQRVLHISLSLGQSLKTAQTDEPFGYRYESSDGKQVVQARRDGYTFSRLEKYETWEKLRREAVRLWNLYKEVAKPEAVKRVAVRYINSFKVKDTLEKYLQAPPTVPPHLSFSMQEFLTRTVVHDDTSDANAIITQGVKEIEDDGSVPLILDIDVYKVVSLEPDDEQIWSTIESFHDVKNDIFFNSITKKAEEMFT